MKKIVTLMLGLSLVAGSVAAFASDNAKDTTKKESKKKKSGKKKTTTEKT